MVDRTLPRDAPDRLSAAGVIWPSFERLQWFESALPNVEQSVAEISRPGGAPAPKFGSDREESAQARSPVYEQAEDGVRRIRGVHLESVKKRLHRHER